MATPSQLWTSVVEWIAPRQGAVVTAAVAGVSAFAGVIVAGALMVGIIDRRLEYLERDAARHGGNLYLSNAYEVTGPGGVGRMLVIPPSQTAPIQSVQCPAWTEDGATCLVIRTIRGG